MQENEQVEVELQITSSEFDVDNNEQAEVNRGLDEMVKEATATKAEVEQQEKNTSSASSLAFTQEQAAELALHGLHGALGIAQGLTKSEIQISQPFQMMFAALVTPCILKYGASIKRLFDAPNQADLDGYMPEALALGGVAMVAIPAYMQVKEQKAYMQQAKQEQAKHGDKSE